MLCSVYSTRGHHVQDMWFSVSFITTITVTVSILLFVRNMISLHAHTHIHTLTHQFKDTPTRIQIFMSECLKDFFNYKKKSRSVLYPNSARCRGRNPVFARFQLGSTRSLPLIHTEEKHGGGFSLHELVSDHRV